MKGVMKIIVIVVNYEDFFQKLMHILEEIHVNDPSIQPGDFTVTPAPPGLPDIDNFFGSVLENNTEITHLTQTETAPPTNEEEDPKPIPCNKSINSGTLALKADHKKDQQKRHWMQEWAV